MVNVEEDLDNGIKSVQEVVRTLEDVVMLCISVVMFVIYSVVCMSLVSSSHVFIKSLRGDVVKMLELCQS